MQAFTRDVVMSIIIQHSTTLISSLGAATGPSCTVHGAPYERVRSRWRAFQVPKIKSARLKYITGVSPSKIADLLRRFFDTILLIPSLKLN